MTLKLSRRLILGAGASALVGGRAFAQAYPTRPIRWIVGYPPGGTTDVLARLMGEWLSRRLGQQVFIDNRPGAGNNIGTDAVAKADPDGYTILLVNPANGINATLYKSLPFNFIRDIAPVAGITRSPNVMEVNPDVPAKTVKEFIDYAKANPGKINMASTGLGTSVHLSGELFKAMTGVEMVHVPFRGAGPALTALLSGTVQALASAPGVLKPQVDEGKLRILGNWGAERIDAFPNVPTFRELGYRQVEFYIWAGLFAPKGLPDEIGAKLRAVMREAMASPEVVRTFQAAGSPPAYLDSAEFSRFVEADSARLIEAVQGIGKVE